MIDRDALLKKVLKIEDKLFLSKILDKAIKSEKDKCEVHTDFMDPYQRSLVEKIFSMADDINYTFNGGYTGAERSVMVLRPDFIEADENAEDPAFLKLMYVKLQGRDVLSHRDYLGSLMGLGIRREKIGDIIVNSEGCHIIVLNEIAEYVKYNLTKVGNVKVSAEYKELHELETPDQKVKEIRTTVASLRLDSVAGAGFGMSRSKVAEFIKAEKVNLNWEMTDSLAKQVKEGDTISIRGRGRVVLEEIGNRTRKDRIGVILKKFI